MTSNFTLTRRAASLLAITAIAAVTSACSTGAEVRTDRDPAADLLAYKTFSFYDTPQSAYMSLLEKRLREATRALLERQHYVYDPRSPDLRVNYALQVVDKHELQPASRGRFGYRGWAYGGVESVEYRHGTLAIDLVDARRNALVWRAVAEGRLDSKALEQPGSTIDAVVGDMFTRFPGAQRP